MAGGRSQIVRSLLREGRPGDGEVHSGPRSAATGLSPSPEYGPGVEITGKRPSPGGAAEDLGDLGGMGGDPMQEAADQVRAGLQTIAAQYPDAQGLLQQFETSMAQWMGGGMAAEEPEPVLEESMPA